MTTRTFSVLALLLLSACVKPLEIDLQDPRSLVAAPFFVGRFEATETACTLATLSTTEQFQLYSVTVERWAGADELAPSELKVLWAAHPSDMPTFEAVLGMSFRRALTPDVPGRELEVTMFNLESCTGDDVCDEETVPLSWGDLEGEVDACTSEPIEALFVGENHQQWGSVPFVVADSVASCVGPTPAVASSLAESLGVPEADRDDDPTNTDSWRRRGCVSRPSFDAELSKLDE